MVPGLGFKECGLEFRVKGCGLKAGRREKTNLLWRVNIGIFGIIFPYSLLTASGLVSFNFNGLERMFPAPWVSSFGVRMYGLVPILWDTGSRAWGFGGLELCVSGTAWDSWLRVDLSHCLKSKLLASPLTSP